MAETWICPHCERPTTIGPGDITAQKIREKVDDNNALDVEIIKCPNPACLRYTVTVVWELGKFYPALGYWSAASTLQTWRLVPESTARSFPDYILLAIRQDYEESCRIRDASPKASATLSRRSLQGMIRDFWNIQGKRNLDGEIKALPEAVTTEVRDAIDAVRGVGNIGAHMEQDVNLIVEVDPEEAEQLISLNEMLLDEWYVARHERQERLASIKALGELKQAERHPPTLSVDDPPEQPSQ